MIPKLAVIRKRIAIAFAAAAIALGSVGCGVASTSTPSPAPTSTGWVTFEDGAFSVDLPDWDEVTAEDEATLKLISMEEWVLSVSKHATIPRLLAHYMTIALPDSGPYVDIEVHDSQADGVILEALTNEQPHSRLHIALLYCDGSTYQLTGSTPEAEFNEFLITFNETLSRAFCSVQPHLALSSRGLIGLVVTTTEDDFSYENYRANIVEARQAGIQTAHSYISWGQVEVSEGIYDWSVPDLMLDTLSLEGLRISVVIELIHTSVRGMVPQDLTGRAFDDTEYMDRAADFAIAVAQRYGDQIDYLSLGNEVNIYLQSNPNDLAPYLAAFSTIRQAVRTVRPGLPVGTVIAFHEAINSDRWGAIEAFKRGDFLAYTYYPHDSGFRYDIATDGFGAILERMISVSGHKPFIVVENGFSSSPALGSDEGRQAQYMRDTFDALSEHRQEFNWHIWFSFHDLLPETCADLAQSFFPYDPDPADSDVSAWNTFQEYLCTLGLRRNDGTPKQAWQALIEELAIYQGR